MANAFFGQRNAQPVSFRNLYGAFNNYDHKDISVEEAIKESKCDYQVEKYPLIKVTDDMIEAIKSGLPLEGLSMKDIITSHCATARTDNNVGLGIVGKDYGVVQNIKAFEFIDFINEVGGVKPMIETAGALGDGERMYVSCKLGEDIFLDDNKQDAVKQYVVFTNAHDGSGSVMVFFTPVRVICQNTLNFAIAKAKNKLVFKHTKNVNERLDWSNEFNRKRALEVFSKSVNFSEHFKEAMLNLRSQSVTAEQIKDFTAKVCLDDKNFALFVKNNHSAEGIAEISTTSKNRMEKLMQSIDFGIGQELYRGTKLWLINGLTTMLHNDTTYKSTEDEYRSLMEGSGLKKVQNAYDWLVAI